MQKKRILTMLMTSAGFLALIFDGHTALLGATSGLEICLAAVIPSLFPFFVLSSALIRTLAGSDVRILKPIGTFMHLPDGTEYFLIPGFLGGYPAGAQSIAGAFPDEKAFHVYGKRVIPVCNNAGPAFIFGMVAPMFPAKKTAWLLWIIHILSAILTGALTDPMPTPKIKPPQSNRIFPDIMLSSVKAISLVCGWVIIFRIVIFFLDRWILWLFPEEIRVIIAGILELSNGCLALSRIKNESVRFVVASGMIAFGGLCVTMQTKSVAGNLFGPEYVKGKLLQTAISIALAGSFVRPLVFFPAILFIILILLLTFRKNSSIPKATVV